VSSAKGLEFSPKILHDRKRIFLVITDDLGEFSDLSTSETQLAQKEYEKTAGKDQQQHQSHMKSGPEGLMSLGQDLET